jgi:hypothetical protein
MGSKRVNVKAILADPDLRRKLMVPTIQAIQAREGIDTTPEQADRAYYIVSESEKAAFFDLERFKGGKGESDRRHERFVQSLRGDDASDRHDVARRDFSSIDSSPLTYQRVGLIAPLFRENRSLEPGVGRARRGAYTGNDARYVRVWWEPGPGSHSSFTWERFAKGGDYCRFYSDVDLVVHWDPARRTFAEFYGRKGRETERPESLDDFFKAGLTWPLRTQRGFNLRVMPKGCVFGHKGPAIFPYDELDTYFLLGIGNSALAEYLLQSLTSFGSWEVGVIKRLPVPDASLINRQIVSELACGIHDGKAQWDKGNETSTRFAAPWLVYSSFPGTGDLSTIRERLDRVVEIETAEEARIRRTYANLNEEVYRLYNIPEANRKTIEETLGDRPPEILWPQMEGKTADQKRMEHVWRLLSYAVKHVLEADDDGIVPFNAVNGEPRLVERVRHELGKLFPDRDASQVEVEIVNELNQTVKGYRRCASLDAWLDNAFFEYHYGLYKSRPIFWHIASAQGTARFAFGAVVHYHRFDKNRLAKLRATYLRDAIEELRREAGLADKAGATADRLEWQAKLEEAQALDLKLQAIQEGHHEGAEGGERDYRILTPWKAPEERPKGWDPDLDDGVKVNIEPLQKAGVLRIAKVI